MPRSRLRLLNATVTAGAALLVMGAPAQAHRLRADGHTNTARLSRAAASANGGRIRAYTGEYVNVTTSPSYGAGTALQQRWANFMAHLEHGPELQRMTVYVAPLAEVFRICGQNHDGCYSTDPTTTLTLPGSGSDPAYVDLIAAHEYGHHVDSSRRNDPWDAGTWGPKYWATYENVCHRVRTGTAFPGDEDKHYSLNPDEAFAEAYAVLNGYAWESQTFDDSFKPDAGALRQIRYDIHEPWTGPAVHRYRGRRRIVKLPEPTDGRLSVKLRTPHGTADLALYTVVNGRRKLLKRVRHRRRGHTTRLRFTICGQYPLQIGVRRRSGSGRYAMTVVEP